MSCLFDRIPKNSEISQNHRKISWVDSKLTIRFYFCNKPASEAKKPRKPPPNASYLRFDLLRRLGFEWVPKRSSVLVPEPATIQTTLQGEKEQTGSGKSPLAPSPIVSAAPVPISKPSDDKAEVESGDVPIRDRLLKSRVQVFLPEYLKYFMGTVVRIDNLKEKSIRVRFDHGDEHWFLPQQVVPLLPEFDRDDVESCSFCFKQCVLFKCSRCKSVAYCGKDCQAADWRVHKPDCKRD